MELGLAELHVSRETIDRLRKFESLVVKWQKTINLISNDTIPDVWHRHVIDSAQIFSVRMPTRQKWLDLGSGGGFPGVVVAIMLHELDPTAQVKLVESDARKATFLRAALRECGVTGQVMTDRIEQLEPQQADVVTARAVAPLSKLLGWGERHLSAGGIALFHKGQNYRDELSSAKEIWRFDERLHISQTDSAARLIEIRNIARAKP